MADIVAAALKMNFNRLMTAGRRRQLRGTSSSLPSCSRCMYSKAQGTRLCDFHNVNQQAPEIPASCALVLVEVTPSQVVLGHVQFFGPQQCKSVR